MFSALLAVVLLADADAEIKAAPRREWFVATAQTSAVVMATRGLGAVPVSAGAEVAFVVVPPARLFFSAGGVELDNLAPLFKRSPSVYFYGGVEGVLTPVLPVELAFAAAIGQTQVFTCVPSPTSPGSGCPVILNARTMLRASIGYQFHPLVSAALIASWNALPGYAFGLASTWFETGLRVSLHL